jgi:hypothetical protein
VAPTIAAQAQAQHDARVAEWEGLTKSDKEFGGAKFDENMVMAKTALKQFGSPELVKLLNDSGLGNHPELVRVFVRAGKAISEDTFVTGGQSAAGKAQPRSQGDYASALYPSKH